MSLKQYSIVQPTWSSLAQIFWQWRSLMVLQPWLDEDELWPLSLTPRTEPFYQVPLKLTPTYSKKPYIKLLKGANPLGLKDFLRINHPPSSHLPAKRTLLLWLFSLITKTKQLRIFPSNTLLYKYFIFTTRKHFSLYLWRKHSCCNRTPCSCKDVPSTTEKTISLIRDQKIKVVFY